MSTRPRNRRQLIVEAAGKVFSERGYHAASMEQIAADVGITAAALYRHFPGKYDLFRDCANLLIDHLLGAVSDLPDDADLDRVLRTIAELTVDHRSYGGIYRWESRYLGTEDLQEIRVKVDRVVRRVVAAAGGAPDPSADDRLRAVAALGAIGSITTHHATMARRRLVDLLTEVGIRVIGTDLAALPRTDPSRVQPVEEPPASRTRSAEILAAAIPLFARDGFANVTLGHIAEVVGVAPSALYRHYPSKVDILAAACLQAATMLDQSVREALRDPGDATGAVAALARAYVGYSFRHHLLTQVGTAEIAGLPEPLRTQLIRAQREHVALWEDHLVAARDDLDPRAARVEVHAGLGVVAESGRLLHWQDGNEERVTALLMHALGL
ncbi:TetR/AcrR family transcriptional regulator [Nocardioides sp. NPDC059952]|uniref:TetR/AcrR family transcriptional regulator n=1 Tax=Nocardioides sp. NPDC059952 TaxID=3347014 RepID=UPI00364B6086